MNELSVKKRFLVVDALRSFSLLTIILVHCTEHFEYIKYPSNLPSWLVGADELSSFFVHSIFAGKSYCIFSLLFGLTFYIQSSGLAKKGLDFGYRFLFRLFWMIGFAYVNTLFFPGGDILLFYATIGLILFFTRNCSNRTLTILAFILLLQPLEWALYFLGFLGENSSTDLYNHLSDNIANGNWNQFFVDNILLGEKTFFTWAFEAGRVSQTAGLFLLGNLAGRFKRFEESEKSTQFWIFVLMGCALIYAPLQIFVRFIDKGYPHVIMEAWSNLSFVFIIVSCFVLSYWYFERFRKICTPLTLHGKMSLSNYLGQSYLGAFIFFPFGLNLAPELGITMSLLVGLLMFTLQLFLSKYWLSRYKQGPLENLWSRLTWLSFPSKKKKNEGLKRSF
ncbi:MAG: DUF418 domain-containing protein [Phocaeicola sp.]